MRYT